MNCFILRNCYVDRYYEKGEVRDVPDSLVKLHPKNFKRVGVVEEEPQSKSVLVCPECGKECKSELGMRSHSRIHK